MPRLRILKVFNRYLHFGGEELSVEKIHRLLAEDHEVIRFPLDSREWTGPDAPGVLSQAVRTVYNAESRRRLEASIIEHRPDFVMMHNIYPVGSPSLYHAAQRLNIPVVQFAHNWRPLSVGGTLYFAGRVWEDPLRGSYWREILHRTWQGSLIKSAVFAIAMKLLHRSGWLDSVKAWICVSEFMRDKFISAGLPSDRVFGLRHAWEPMKNPPPPEDGGYYLFLSRLVDVKGVAVLLRAWQAIRDGLGDRTPDLWVAGEGPLEGMVRDAMRQNPSVHYRGMITGVEKVETIRRCRAMIVPSVWWEPLGLVTCEAYDYSKPVLAAASGGLTETVRDGVTGFLHTPGSEMELKRDVIAMEALTPERRDELGRAGRQWLLNETGVAAWKNKFADILSKTILAR